MLFVGLTGGIGSGKSTACRVFEALGVPVYDSDTNAKRIMVSDPAVISGLKSILGDGVFTEGELNKAYVADLIFNDKSLLSQINSTVHPAVMRDFNEWAKRFENCVPYVIQENAILFEGGFDRFMDRTITISAPIEERIARASERDNTLPEKVMERIRNQKRDNERERLADHVINNAEYQLMVPQIITLHGELTTLAKNKQ